MVDGKTVSLQWNAHQHLWRKLSCRSLYREWATPHCSPSLLAIHANSIPVFRHIPPYCTRIYQMQKTQLSAHCPLIHIGRVKSCEGFKKSPTFLEKTWEIFQKTVGLFFCICRRIFKSPPTLYCYPRHFRSATADAPLQR